jgi:hypothetical protein
MIFRNISIAMVVVFRKMIGYAGDTGMHIGTPPTSSLVISFACCGFDQWWPTQKDGSLVFDDHGFIAHGWNIGATSCA